MPLEPLLPLIVTALTATERAWDVVTGALALAPPDPELDGAWHVYLVDDVDGGSTALLAARDPLAHLDRASSFALVDRGIPVGCPLDFALARAVAQASLWRMAPATDVGSARAETQMLARLATPCYVGTTAYDEERVFQDEPRRAIVDPASRPRSTAARPSSSSGSTPTSRRIPAHSSAACGRSLPPRPRPGAWRWSGAPTGFDVLRVSLKNALGTDSTLDDVLARFSVHRALAAPAARVAWHVPWPSKARRFASPIPVTPTGSSVVLIDLAGAPAGAKLRVEAAWEDFGRMRWEIVKLDAKGYDMADIHVTSLPLGTSASMTVEPLDGVDRVAVVGVNVGSTEQPFQPNQGWWEPHGWLLFTDRGARAGDRSLRPRLGFFALTSLLTLEWSLPFAQRAIVPIAAQHLEPAVVDALLYVVTFVDVALGLGWVLSWPSSPWASRHAPRAWWYWHNWQPRSPRLTLFLRWARACFWAAGPSSRRLSWARSHASAASSCRWGTRR